MHIVFIICDTLRKDFIGCYRRKHLPLDNYPPVETPNLDAFAEEAVIFDNAWIGSFPTIPARAEILAGKHVFHTIGWAPLPPGIKTVPELLRQRGYVTMLITDHYQLLAPGMNYHRGFNGHWWVRGHQSDAYITDHGEVKLPCAPEKLRQPDRLVIPYLRNRAYWVYERDWLIPKVINAAIDWLERNYRHDRFFLYLDIFSVHEPWDPPRWYVERYDPGYEGEEVILPRYDRADYLTERELRHVRALYAGVVTMMDKWVGWLLEKLHDLGVWEETAIILTSDHGFYHGEHGFIGKHTVLEPQKGWPLYTEVAAIPLLMKVPGIKGGWRCGALVQLVDLMPTLLELGGVSPPEGLHGRSLLPLLWGEKISVRELAVSSPTLPTDPERLVWSAVTDGEWALMEPGRLAKPELYYLPTDPYQTQDVSEKHWQVAERLHHAYLEFLGSIGTAPEKLRLREWEGRRCER